MPLFRSNGRNIYFAHVPRCGGTSVEDYLGAKFGELSLHDPKFRDRRRGRWYKTSPQHILAEQLNVLFAPGFIDEAFAVVRHPVDRLRSAFHFQRDFEKTIEPTMTLAEFVDKLSDPGFRYSRAFDNHFQPQVKIVPKQARIFRFEDGLDAVLDHIDMIAGTSGKRGNTPHRLRTGRPSEPISPELPADIATLFADDMEAFGYDLAPDAWIRQPRTNGVTQQVQTSGLLPLKPGQLSFVVQMPVPNEKVQDTWGDYYFAQSLCRALERCGHKARTQVKDKWDHREDEREIDIALTGNIAYAPRPGNLTFVWLIYNKFLRSPYSALKKSDHVFVAGQPLLDSMTQSLGSDRCSLLPQAFDADLMAPPKEGAMREGAAFVGLARKYGRPIVAQAFECGASLRLWGAGWQDTPAAEFFQGDRLPQADLPSVYSEAEVVLNDHRNNMRTQGIPSNRIFDALACAAPVITDEVAWLPEDIAPFVYKVSNATEFGEAYAAVRHESEEIKEKRRQFALEMRETHSFDQRARQIVDKAQSLLKIADVEKEKTWSN